ncbi:hypothetical protein LTS10_002137 [Elasticomyces elasticus]|nr:hypothetical protein LTS10_002137 [Elasticomyces elasticus]
MGRKQQFGPPDTPFHTLVRRGLWFRAREATILGQEDVLARLMKTTCREALGGVDEVEWRSLSLPNIKLRWLAKAVVAAREEAVSLQSTGSASTECSSGGGHTDGKCRLLALPDELLLRVLRHLVPSGGVMHVARQYERNASNPTEWVAAWHEGEEGDSPVVNHLTDRVMCQADTTSPDSDDNTFPIRTEYLALARTCRRMNDVFCSIFYSENQWLFEFSEGGRWPGIVALPPRTGSMEVDCWSRKYEPSPARLAAWPLSKHTASYVRELSALFPMSGVVGTVLEHSRMGPVAGTMEDLCTEFKGECGLKKVTIDVAPVDAMCVAGRLWFECSVRPGGRLILDMLERGGNGEASEVAEIVLGVLGCLREKVDEVRLVTLEDDNVLARLPKRSGEETGEAACWRTTFLPTIRSPHAQMTDTEDEMYSSTLAGLAGESHDDKCRLLALPDELLLKVLRYIVPSGGCFYVVCSDGDARVINHLATHVDEFGPSQDAQDNDTPVRPALLAVTRTNRRMSDICYSILYGDNQWLFEMHASGSKRRWPARVAFPPNPSSGWECWSREYDPEEPRMAAWPLSRRTARYVHNLSVLVTVDRGQPTVLGGTICGRLDVVRTKLGGLLAIFDDWHSLKSIAVDVASLRTLYEAGRIWLVGSMRSDGVRMIFAPIERQDGAEESQDVEALWHVVGRIQSVEEVRMTVDAIED